MAIQTSSAVLKAYFETGDVPTAAQFGEFIDSTAYYDYSLEKLFLSGSGTGSIPYISAKSINPYTGLSAISVSASLIPPYTSAGSGSNLGSETAPWVQAHIVSASINHLSKHTGSAAITVSGGLSPVVTSGDGVGFSLGTPSAKWKELHVSGINVDYISSSVQPDQTNLRNLGSSTRQFLTIFAQSASLEYISASNGSLGTTIEIAKINQVSGTLLPFDDNAFDLGSAAKSWKDLHVQGTATIGTLALSNVATMIIGTASIDIVSSSRIDGIGGYGNIIISGGLVPGTTNVFDLGTTTTKWGILHISGVNVDYVSSSLIPDQDDLRDLGSSTREWKDLYIDGTANIDTLLADTASIGRVTNLIPTTDGAYFIGTPDFKFKNIHVVSSSIDFVSSSLIPHTTSTWDLGSSTLKWRSASIQHITASTIIVDRITANTTVYIATNTITSSNQFGSSSSHIHSFSGSISAITHITASGNISSSGTITAATFNFANSSINTADISSSGHIWVSGGSAANLIFLSKNGGHITSSGNISSSKEFIGASAYITNITASNNIIATGIIYSAGMITSSVGFSTIGGHFSASDESGSVQIISGGIYHSKTIGSSNNNDQYTIHGRRFIIKNQLQSTLLASQSSGIFTVNNHSVNDGDVVIGTFMGGLGSLSTLALSASIHCFTTASLSTGFKFYIHNNQSTNIADNTTFTASFVVL